MKNLIIISLLFSLCTPISHLNAQNQADEPTSVIKYKLDQEIAQEWDEASSQLVNDVKSEYAYDENGNLTQYVVSLWQGVQWANESKTEFVYDANGYLIQNLDYAWIQQQWVTVEKTDYTRDSNGNTIQKILYSWDEYQNQWLSSWKTEFTYDDTGKLIQEIVYNGNYQNPWIEYAKAEYTYAPNGNLIQEIRHAWYGQWYENMKIDYTSDTNENLLQFIVNWWDEGTNQWITTDKTEYTYDTNGNLLEDIEYWWDDFENQWQNVLKVEYSFNNLYSYSDLILPYFYQHTELGMYFIHHQMFTGLGTIFNVGEVFFNHMMTNRLDYEWDSNLNDWTVRRNIDFSYSEQEMLSISDIEIAELKIFPNPATSILTVKTNNPIEKVEIYSLSGKKVDDVNSDFNNINVEELSNGMYLLRIYTEKEIMVEKMIKK